MWETQWCLHSESISIVIGHISDAQQFRAPSYHSVDQAVPCSFKGPSGMVPQLPTEAIFLLIHRSRLPSLPRMTSLLSPTLPTHKSSAKRTIYTQRCASESASGEHKLRHSGSQPASSKGSHISYFLSYSQFLPFLLLFLHGVNPYWKFQQGVFYAVTTLGKGLFIFEPEYQRTEECPLPWGQSGEGRSSTHGDSYAHWGSKFPGHQKQCCWGTRGQGQRSTRALPTFQQDDSGNLRTGQRTLSATKPRAEVQIP